MVKDKGAITVDLSIKPDNTTIIYNIYTKEVIAIGYASAWALSQDLEVVEEADGKGVLTEDDKGRVIYNGAEK